MRAIETVGTVDAQGHIQLDTPQPQVADRRVRVVMLLDESIDVTPVFAPAQRRSPPRTPGQDQGKVWIANDFNDPLPETILNDFLAPL